MITIAQIVIKIRTSLNMNSIVLIIGPKNCVTVRAKSSLVKLNTTSKKKK